jgi:arabinofuranosyltransferase
MHLSRRIAAALSHPLAPYAFALALQLVFVGYVKDDAYIEYRYATNAAHGHGLVYNVGDPPVEGFTSFLWTVLLIVPAWLHVPLLAFGKLAGGAAMLGCIALVAALVRARGGDDRAQQLARWLAATNASLLVWAQSGMEPVQTALAVVACAYFLQRRRHWPAMLLVAAAALMRPECHVVLALAAALVVWRRAPLPALVALALVGGVHLWRYEYFGALLPNTALVKVGPLVLRAGLRYAGELMVTSLAGVCIALTLVEAWRARDGVSLLSAAAVMVFVAYLVRIGRDEMFLVRLFLPVWPLTIAMAAPWLARRWQPLAADVARVLLAAGIVVSGLVCIGLRLHTVGYWALGERSHVPLANLMRAHAKAGDMVVFQDLGQTPWAAMELRFIDPIGLVDSTIAKVRWREHASPFLRMPTERGQAEIRDRLFAVSPRLVAFVAYVDQQYAADVEKQLAAAHGAREREAVFAPFLTRNPYYCGMYDDGRFAQFRFVDIIRRKDTYWFVLFERA